MKCVGWREHFIELVKDNGIRDVGAGTIGVEVRRVRKEYGIEENLTKELRRAVIHLRTWKA